MLMTMRTSAGSKASRIMLFCHLLAPDLVSNLLMGHSKPLLIPQSALTVRGHRVAVMTELTWAFCEQMETKTLWGFLTLILRGTACSLLKLLC